MALPVPLLTNKVVRLDMDGAPRETSTPLDTSTSHPVSLFTVMPTTRVPEELVALSGSRRSRSTGEGPKSVKGAETRGGRPGC
jgi:hypothetical protein